MDEQQIDEYLQKNLPQDALNRLQTHKVLTPRELANLVGVKPQVIYSYTRTGRIRKSFSETGKQVITRDALYDYLDKRLTKELQREQKIRRELLGER